MKLKTILFMAFSILALACVSAYAMGGPAPEVPQGKPAVPVTVQTPEAQPAPATPEANAADVAKARAETVSLEAEREKIDNYLESLNMKIMQAKIARDSKKEQQLQATERAMSERENKISQKIISIRDKYPELNNAETTGAGVTENQQQAGEQKTAGQHIAYHDVILGDTLMSISRKYFGTPAYYKDIAKMNNLDPHGPLSQGTSLKIDLSLGGGKVGTTVTAKKTAVKKAATKGITYYAVAKGDTLMSISRKYFNGSSSYYKEIAEMNGITGTGLKIGMKLKIDTTLKKTAKPAL